MFSGLLASPVLPRVLAAFDGRPDRGLLWGPAASMDVSALAGWKIASEAVTEESGARIFRSCRQLAREARCFMNRLGLDRVRLRGSEGTAARDSESVTFVPLGGTWRGWNEIAIGANFLSLKRQADFRYAGIRYSRGLASVPGGPHWRHDYFVSFSGPSLLGVRRCLDLPHATPLEAVAASLAAALGIPENLWDREWERSEEAGRISRLILDRFGPRGVRRKAQEPGTDQEPLDFLMGFELNAHDELDVRIRSRMVGEAPEEKMSFGFSAACLPGAWIRPLPEILRPLWDLAFPFGSV